MTADHQGFEQLLSDEVFLEGALASDVSSLWRRLSRQDDVRNVARTLASDRERIQALCGFANELIDMPYDKGFRHPHDVAICAALVVLQTSPLSDVRALFAKLRKDARPSLVWVRRMASFCDDTFVESLRFVESLCFSASLQISDQVVDFVKFEEHLNDEQPTWNTPLDRGEVPSLVSAI